MTTRYVFGSREFWLWQNSGYWYAVWNDGGKRRRSLKTKSHEVALRRLEELASELDPRVLPTLLTYASGLLRPGDPYLQQKALTPHTITCRVRCFDLLCEWFGDEPLGSPSEVEIERRIAKTPKWRDRPYSASYQQQLMSAYMFVMRRAKRDGYDVRMPEFYLPDRNTRRRDVLKATEIQRLFPDSFAEIARVYDEGDGYGLMFGLLYRTILHGGLRPGEGRAVGRHQFYPEHNALVVSRRLDNHNEVRELKKRKYGDTDVFRIVVLPTRTTELLSQWIEQTEPQDFLFRYQGEPVRQKYICQRWKRALKRAEIPTAGRQLDVYSLRYTYRSMTEGMLPRDFLLHSMGHRSAEVHDGYLRFLERQVEAAGARASEVDEVWRTKGQPSA